MKTNLNDIVKRTYRCIRDLFWLVVKKKKAQKDFNEKIEHIKNAENRTLKQERVFYVIRRQARVGLFSYVQTTLAQIEFALDKGYIPIVDMKNYDNSYLESDEIGKVNAWELYFEQVCDFDLDDVYANETFILSEESNINHIPCSDGFYKKEALWYWGEMYSRFIKLNKKSTYYIENEVKEIFNGNVAKVLGVHVRGTDYRHAKGHPVQPEVADVMNVVDRYIRKGKYEKIFLATEESKIVEMFKKRFPGKVITNSCMYYDSYTDEIGNIVNVKFSRENDAYLKGMEYLSTIVILSKCQGLVCGLNGGAYAALYLNNGKFKDNFFFDLGTQE